MMNKKILIGLFAFLVLISGCAEDNDPDNFTWADIGRDIAVTGGIDSTGTGWGGGDPLIMGIAVMIAVAWILTAFSKLSSMFVELNVSEWIEFFSIEVALLA